MALNLGPEILPPHIQQLNNGERSWVFVVDRGIEFIKVFDVVLTEDFVALEELFHLLLLDALIMEGIKAGFFAFADVFFGHEFGRFGVQEFFDVGLGGSGFADVEPAFVWSRRVLRGADFANVTGLEGRVERSVDAIDHGSNRRIADFRVNFVSEIERGGALREINDLS